MRSQRKGGLSAIAKVKVFSPVIFNIALGQGFHVLEASTAARVNGECVSDFFSAYVKYANRLSKADEASLDRA